MNEEIETPQRDVESNPRSLQEIHAPRSLCFGCGPANERGLRLRSYTDGDRLVASWRPEAHHLAFAGVVNGGILSTLLDCHCNWTAAFQLMQRDQLQVLPSTVTAELKVQMLKPTALDATLELVGEVKRLGKRSATTAGSIFVGGVMTATCEATFVAVAEGHPAFRRWAD